MSHRRLAALYAMQGIAFGLLMPFPVPLLDERGLGAAQIGLILGVAGLVSLMAYPAWGAIADGWLGRPRTIVLTSLTAALGGGLILLAGSDPLALTLALSVALVGALSWGPLIDALTLEALGEGSAGYGRIRVWGSAGWAASATVGGAVWSVAGAGPVFGAFVAGSLLLVPMVLWAARAHGARGSDGSPAASGDGTRIAGSGVVSTETGSTETGSTGAASTGAASTGAASGPRPRPTLRDWLPRFTAPLLLGFLAGLFVTSLGEHASWRFISLRILDQGGGVFLVGLAASLPALVEIPVFASSRRLSARLGLRGLFVGGAIVAAVLMALVAVVPEPWMVTALRTLEGAAYALRYMGMVLIIGVLLPRHLYALGQSVAWLVHAGIAPIIADAAGGFIYATLGASALFLAATAALALGGGIVWVVLRGPAFGRGAPLGRVIEVAQPPPPPA